MTTQQPQLLWQGKPVGLVDNLLPDMWYLTGTWLSNRSEAATAFEVLAKQLDPQDVRQDWDTGIEIIIQDLDEQTRAIVFSLSPENLLFVRRIYS